MSLRSIVGGMVILILVASVVGIATYVRAQGQEIVPLPAPVVVSGSDIGFRIEGTQGTTVVGRLVVRRNGQWIEAASRGGTLQLAAK